MRILHAVEFYHPSVGGAQAVVRQLSERLAAHGHEVTVATSWLPGRAGDTLDGVRLAPFRVSGNLVRGLAGEIERYQQFVAAGGFDVVMVYAAQQWTLDALLPVLPGLAAKKVLVPCGFSGLHWPAYQDYFRRMPEILGHFDALVFMSDRYRDVAFARVCGAGPRVLIPNGAAAEEFATAATGFGERHGITTASLLLTVGSHTGLKGHSVAIEGFRRAPLRDATLVIVGDRVQGGCAGDCARRAAWTRFSPRERSARKSVRLLSLDRAETLAAYRAADLVLFPSRMECSPLVLFEAMAAGVPFAATPAGNAEEIIEWSGGGMLIPGREAEDGTTVTTADEVARVVGTLMSDAPLRRRLGEQGQVAWRARFTFERIAAAYEALYQRLARGEEVVGDA